MLICWYCSTLGITQKRLDNPEVLKCCVDFPPVVKLQLKVGWKSSVWKSQAVGHPQLKKMLAVLTLIKALMVAVLWQSL